jgi:hypothetical protein
MFTIEINSQKLLFDILNIKMAITSLNSILLSFIFRLNLPFVQINLRLMIQRSAKINYSISVGLISVA